MEKTRKEQLKEHVASGSASFAGAAAGVAVGTFAMAEEAAAQEVSADNSVTTNTAQEVPTASQHNEHPQTQSTAHHTPSPQPQLAQQPEPQPQPTPQPEPEPQPDPTPEPGQNIEVLGYQTITATDGSQSDVAVVSVNGETAIYVDIDQNGTADILVADVNHNNQLEGDEIIDITGHQMPMPHPAETGSTNTTGTTDTTNTGITPSATTGHDNNLIADNSDQLPDYVNDANVGDYIA